MGNKCHKALLGIFSSQKCADFPWPDHVNGYCNQQTEFFRENTRPCDIEIPDRLIILYHIPFGTYCQSLFFTIDIFWVNGPILVLMDSWSPGFFILLMVDGRLLADSCTFFSLRLSLRRQDSKSRIKKNKNLRLDKLILKSKKNMPS